MALHGTVCVNGTVVAAWCATRQLDDTGTPGTYRYEVDYDAEPGVRVRGVTVHHVYADGAAVLAAKALAAAAEHLAAAPV